MLEPGVAVTIHLFVTPQRLAERGMRATTGCSSISIVVASSCERPCRCTLHLHHQQHANRQLPRFREQCAQVDQVIIRDWEAAVVRA